MLENIPYLIMRKLKPSSVRKIFIWFYPFLIIIILSLTLYFHKNKKDLITFSKILLLIGILFTILGTIIINSSIEYNQLSEGGEIIGTSRFFIHFGKQLLGNNLIITGSFIELIGTVLLITNSKKL